MILGKKALSKQKSSQSCFNIIIKGINFVYGIHISFAFIAQLMAKLQFCLFEHFTIL